MKYQVKLVGKMRLYMIILMFMVVLGIALVAGYGAYTSYEGTWYPGGYIFAGVISFIGLVILIMGIRDMMTVIAVFPGKRIIVHKGTSTKSYNFSDLSKPKPRRQPVKRPKDEQLPQHLEDSDDSLLVRTKEGKHVIKIPAIYKHVRWLEEDLHKYGV